MLLAVSLGFPKPVSDHDRLQLQDIADESVTSRVWQTAQNLLPGLRSRPPATDSADGEDEQHARSGNEHASLGKLERPVVAPWLHLHDVVEPEEGLAVLHTVESLAAAGTRAAVHGGAPALPGDALPGTRLSERQVALIEHPVVRG